jgi:hypothetical protein
VDDNRELDHEHDHDHVGDHNGTSIKIVKSILKPSTKPKPPQPNKVFQVQHWWSSKTTTSSGGKTQQEILSSINSSGTTTFTTPATVTNHPMHISATNPNFVEAPAAQERTAQRIRSDIVPVVDTAIINSLMAEPPDMNLAKNVVAVASVASSDGHQLQRPDSVHPPPHRLKKVAAKTLLSKPYQPNIASSDFTGSSATRPPTEVTISTPTRKVPVKKSTTAKEKRKAIAVEVKSKIQRAVSVATTAKQKRNTTTGSTAGKAKSKSQKDDSAVTSDNSPEVSNPVWEGVPNDVVSFDIDWSTGWMKRSFARRSGASKGSIDRYWYTPQKHFKLRSLKEVERFVRFCAENNNNEDLAFKSLKQRVK